MRIKLDQFEIMEMLECYLKEKYGVNYSAHDADGWPCLEITEENKVFKRNKDGSFKRNRSGTVIDEDKSYVRELHLPFDWTASLSVFVDPKEEE
tara:strand:- start:963 stop:1244 length:282 start_codon:yes stop_codon:yes gene_type:complete